MQTLLVAIIAGLIGGAAVSMQTPLANMIGQKLGSMESVFIIHIGGAIASLIILLFMGGGELKVWRTVPWYALAAGILGVIVVTSVTIAMPRAGALTTTVLMLVGQLFIASLLDHFGLLVEMQRAITPTKVIGMVVLLVGAWLVVK
jgi:transporter family-2 protein